MVQKRVCISKRSGHGQILFETDVVALGTSVDVVIFGRQNDSGYQTD